jgi:phospholipid-binding lipoprotein MlaA
MRHARAWVTWAIALALPPLLAACAGVPRDASLPINDPNEQSNRHLMAANQAMLGPAARVVKALPGPLHDRVHDLNSHLKEPRIFVNNILQGRFDAAHTTAARFLANSLFGLAGLFDVATLQGLQQNSGDFGQTLFVWGVPEGPYVVRPYLGPATVRDAFGSAVDMVSDPVGWVIGPKVALSISTSLLDAADRLGELKQAEDASIDFYSFVRSAYYQSRRAELREAIGLPSAIDSPALEDPDEPAAGAKVESPPATRRSQAKGQRSADHHASGRVSGKACRNETGRTPTASSFALTCGLTSAANSSSAR